MQSGPQELSVAPIIGLEVHVQLATRTKLFCGCPVEFGGEPNSHVCPVCLGLPGALPVVNEKALELAVRTALALNCRIAEVTRLDRKNYFYPDLPKNYQISQYARPLGVDGFFEFAFGTQNRRVRIRRVHLEEDAGKLIHDPAGWSAVDLNRAGTPLLEIVTEPDLHSAEEAREFAVELQRLVRYLGVSEADMQKGQVRFEPNINLRIERDGRQWHTPIVEVKNLNSFRALYLAVRCEVARQLQEWLETGAVEPSASKTNRGWDDVHEVTVPQREKEEVPDYRYFADPDLPPLVLDSAWISRLADQLPELPVRRAERFMEQFAVGLQEAFTLVNDRPTADLLDAAVALGGDGPALARHFLSFWARHASRRGVTIAELGVWPQRMAELANLVRDGRLSVTAAAMIAEKMLESGDRPEEIAARLDLLQIQDERQLLAWVDEVLGRHPQAARDAVGNPRKQRAARDFLAGQVMKLSGGRADPRLVRELIDRLLLQRDR